MTLDDEKTPTIRTHWTKPGAALVLALLMGCSGQPDATPRAAAIAERDAGVAGRRGLDGPAAPSLSTTDPVPTAAARAAVAPGGSARVTPSPGPSIPDDYAGAMRVGRSARDAGDLALALTAFDRAAELAPRRAAPHTDAARAYLERGDRVRARVRAEQAIELDDTSSAAWNTLGRVELAEGGLDAAAASFERAGELNRDNSYAWNNLGFVRLEQERYGDAVVALERATSGSVVAAYMWNNLGMAYEHCDRLDEARAAYDQGADAGSALAAAHRHRLEGVDSIATDVAVAGAEPLGADDPDEAADSDLEGGGDEALPDGSARGDVASTPMPTRE